MPVIESWKPLCWPFSTPRSPKLRPFCPASLNSRLVPGMVYIDFKAVRYFCMAKLSWYIRSMTTGSLRYWAGIRFSVWGRFWMMRTRSRIFVTLWCPTRILRLEDNTISCIIHDRVKYGRASIFCTAFQPEAYPGPVCQSRPAHSCSYIWKSAEDSFSYIDWTFLGNSLFFILK